MSETKDDPREILVLLNSLGFVGITAAQLKAFMKGKCVSLIHLSFSYLPIFIPNIELSYCNKIDTTT